MTYLMFDPPLPIFPFPTFVLQLCGSEEFWEQAVRQHCYTVSDEVAELAMELGWRSIFFTSKLQLQKLINRRRLRGEGQQEGHLSGPDPKAEESPDDTSETTFEEESNPNLSLCTDSGSELL